MKKRTDHYLPMIAIRTKTCRHSMTVSSMKIPKNQKTSRLLNSPHTIIKEDVGWDWSQKTDHPLFTNDSHMHEILLISKSSRFFAIVRLLIRPATVALGSKAMERYFMGICSEKVE